MSKRSLIPSPFKHEPDLLKTFRREMNKFFHDFWDKSHFEPAPFRLFESSDYLSLNIDFIEKDNAFEVTAELPGMNEDDIHIEINKDILTIKGEKKVKREDKGDNYYIAERSAGFFHRAIPIPATVDENAVEAKMKNGILTITLPKSRDVLAQSKKIKIRQAS